MLRLRTFGGLALERDGASSPAMGAQRKALALLAVLAASGDRGVGRDRLLALFWPESDGERARGTLKQTLHVLRRRLGGAQAIEGTAELRLNPSYVDSDVRAFQRACEAGDLEAAVAEYGGPFLDGVFIDDGAEFERWASDRRRELALQHSAALEQLARAADERGAAHDAIRWWQRLHSEEPLNSRVAAGLMAALATAGDRAGALHIARAHELLLREELGIAPPAEVVALVTRLREPAHSAGPVPPVDRAAAPHSPVTNTTPAMTPPAAPVGSAPPDPSGPAVSAPSARLRRPVAPRLLAGLLLVAGLVALGWALWPQEAAPPIDPRRVVVGVFENRTGDAALDGLGHVAGDWVAREIARTTPLEVLDASTLYTEEQRLSGSVQGLARRNGAGMVVAGSYHRSGDTLFFSARILDGASGRLLRAVDPIGGGTADPLPAIEELRQRAATALVTMVDPFARNFSSPASRPPLYAAYQEFVTAHELYWRGAFRAAMPHFRRAAELDPDFLTGTLWLGVGAVGNGRCDVVDSIAGVLAPFSARLSQDERQQLGTILARCRNDWDEVLRLQRARAERLPSSSLGPWAAAVAARRANRPAEAITLLQRIDPAGNMSWLRDGGAPFYWREITAAQHMAGDHAAEQRAAAAWSRSAPPRLAAAYVLARSHAGLGRANAAIEALAGVEHLTPDPALVSGEIAGRSDPAIIGVPGWVLYQIATELLAHGRPEAAHRTAERAVAWFAARSAGGTPPEHTLMHAQALELLGHHDEAVALLAPLLAQDSANIEVRGALGVLAARRGDTRAAADADRWLADAPYAYPLGAAILQRARIAAVLGHHEQALTLLESLPHRLHPMDFLFFHSDPALADIRAHERFRSFVQPRG